MSLVWNRIVYCLFFYCVISRKTFLCDNWGDVLRVITTVMNFGDKINGNFRLIVYILTNLLFLKMRMFVNRTQTIILA
jgi:hypothetical protein